MSIATFESPEVASQRFFPWVFDDEADYGFSDTGTVQEFVAETEVATNAILCESRSNDQGVAEVATNSLLCESRSNDQRVAETRLGTPVRLGAVMLKLLKSYGITDDEIAEGMAAYAAKAGLC